MSKYHISTRLNSFKAVTYTKAYGMFHKIRPQILCASFKGKQYSDSPRAISEMLHQLHPEIDVVWALNVNDDPYQLVPPYVKKVKYGSHEFYRALAESFCFITNNEIRPNISKRNQQFFVQTWHGDRGFKKILYDNLSKESDRYRANVVRDNFVTDVCMAGSSFGEGVYRSAFNYKREILNVGMPRNDLLLNNHKEKADLIRKSLGVKSDEKIVMYAPTFRDKKLEEACELIDLNKLVPWLSCETGDTWIAFYRAHNLGKGVASCGNVKDVSDYPDMADLLLISDAVITDYSSVAGDYMLTNRPMVLAVFDEKEYMSNCRQFKVTPEDTGFPLARNMEELHALLLQSIKENRLIGYEKAMSFYGVTESGEATKKIVERIEKHYFHCFK